MLKYWFLLPAAALLRYKAPSSTATGQYLGGVVQDEMQNPLVGALVHTAGPLPQLCLTNAEGCFRLRRPGAGRQLWVSLPGYQTQRQPVSRLYTGVIVLVPGTDVPGRRPPGRWLYRQCRALATRPE